MSIAERIDSIREKMEKAALRSGRMPGDIQLMGVSKFHGCDKIGEAVKVGISLFGESRVQEAAKKFPALKEKYPGICLHLIGKLQRNKVKNVSGIFDGVQSLDRDELIIALGNVHTGKPLPVLLEMHTGEATKSGYPNEDALSRAVELVLSFSGLILSGLMTMAPFVRQIGEFEERLIRQSFRKLTAVRVRLQQRFPHVDFSCLSMGMSNDYEIAIEEGSTLVRIGTALFGTPSEDLTDAARTGDPPGEMQ